MPVPAALAAAGQEEQVGVGVVLTAPTAEPDRQQVTAPLGGTRQQSLAEQAQEAQQLVRQPGQQPQTVQPQRRGQAPWRGKLSEREEVKAENQLRSPPPGSGLTQKEWEALPADAQRVIFASHGVRTDGDDEPTPEQRAAEQATEQARQQALAQAEQAQQGQQGQQAEQGQAAGEGSQAQAAAQPQGGTGVQAAAGVGAGAAPTAQPQPQPAQPQAQPQLQAQQPGRPVAGQGQGEIADFFRVRPLQVEQDSPFNLGADIGTGGPFTIPGFGGIQLTTPGTTDPQLQQQGTQSPGAQLDELFPGLARAAGPAAATAPVPAVPGGTGRPERQPAGRLTSRQTPYSVSSVSQTSLYRRERRHGVPDQSTGTRPAIATVAECSSSARAGPTKVAPTSTRRSSSSTSWQLPLIPSPWV